MVAVIAEGWPNSIDFGHSTAAVARCRFGLTREQSIHYNQQRGKSDVSRDNQRHSALWSGSSSDEHESAAGTADDAQESSRSGPGSPTSRSAQQACHPAQEISGGGGGGGGGGLYELRCSRSDTKSLSAGCVLLPPPADDTRRRPAYTAAEG